MSRHTLDQAPGTRWRKNDQFIEDESQTWLALFDTSDNGHYVGNNCGFTIGQAYPGYSGMRITGIECDLVKPQVTNPATNGLAAQWRISLEYGPWDPLTHSASGDPTTIPLKFRLDFTIAEVAAFVDVDGDPIVNSAGDPYDPPLMREVTRCTLTVMRNEAATSININTLAALSNTTNAAVWNNFPIKTAKLNPIKLPDILYSPVTNQFYFPMQYVFDINYDTWIKQVINAGFRQLDADGNLIPILINGQPAQTPVPLDENGHAILAPGSLDSSGDTPPDTSSGGYSGEVAGGGEPPEGGIGDLGTGEGATPNIVIDAYDLLRTSDFTVLNLNTIFTLPTLP